MSTVEERFWALVDRRGPDECWEWTGFKLRGYGTFSPEHGKTRQAQRVSYELLVGPIPEGLTTDHLCLNRGCVNPAHLEPVTQDEQNQRKTWVFWKTRYLEAKEQGDYWKRGYTDAFEKLARAEERAEQAEDERSVYRKHYFEQKERAESIALRMGARIQELELEQDNAGFIPWAGAQDVLNELTERAEKAERAHNRYEAAWKNSSRYWSARVQELEAALTDVKLDANERARADSIRIQELEAATRHLFAELDRGYGAAEAFGRLRRALLAGSEA